MSDLVTWLRAQLDEDERVARQATAGPWRWRTFDMTKTGKLVLVAGADTPVVKAASADVWPSRDDALFMETHNPKRALDEVEARRLILDDYAAVLADYTEQVQIGGPGPYTEMGYVWLERVVKLLALPYADRPGYDDSWRP